MYCKDSVFFLCGDYNSRCSNLYDYIPGVDKVVERDVVDFTLNKYGEIFFDFLINSKCSILNGRNFIANNFTFIGPNGSSVVDYCVVPYEHLANFSDFNVTLVSELFSAANIADLVHSWS